jgi:hypothetical protein
VRSSVRVSRRVYDSYHVGDPAPERWQEHSLSASWRCWWRSLRSYAAATSASPPRVSRLLAM